MDNITHFQHITNSKDSFRQIQRDGKLKSFPSLLPGWCPLAQRPDIIGVWFSSNLQQHQLPTVSPYGKHRIMVSIDSILANMENPTLHMESTYYTSTDDISLQYVRFILAPRDYPNVPNGCLEVNILSNPFLILNKATGEYSSIHNEYGVLRRDNIRFFVEVFVVGDVDLNVKYDTVKHVGDSPLNAKRGLVPEAAIVAGMANI